MCCPYCEGVEDVFSRGYARKELEAYRKRGADGTTNWLIDALKQRGVDNMTLLDVGGGVGAIQLALLQAGIHHAVDVDASSAYINVAKEEAQAQQVTERITYHHGDFVQLAPELEHADIVTLDRVVCCYPDMEALVQKSSSLAKRFYALVYPRDNILMRVGIRFLNFFAFRLSGNPFRTFVHPTKQVDSIVRRNGFSPFFQKQGLFWQVVVYER